MNINENDMLTDTEAAFEAGEIGFAPGSSLASEFGSVASMRAKGHAAGDVGIAKARGHAPQPRPRNQHTLGMPIPDGTKDTVSAGGGATLQNGGARVRQVVTPSRAKRTGLRADAIALITVVNGKLSQRASVDNMAASGAVEFHVQRQMSGAAAPVPVSGAGTAGDPFVFSDTNTWGDIQTENITDGADFDITTNSVVVEIVLTRTVENATPGQEIQFELTSLPNADNSVTSLGHFAVEVGSSRHPTRVRLLIHRFIAGEPVALLATDMISNVASKGVRISIGSAENTTARVIAGVHQDECTQSFAGLLGLSSFRSIS